MTSPANYSASSYQSSLQPEFALWAQSYDLSPNPLLELERRILSPLIPCLEKRDIVDIGCGTGRWLERLARLAPRTLTGIDYSVEMLNRAKDKGGRLVRLAVADASTLPLPNGSVDIVIASFLLSYVDKLDAFSAEIHRVLRYGGRVYLSDMHPDTAAKCNWDRGFRAGDRRVTLNTRARSLQHVCSCWEAAGFEVKCLFEPPFDSPERAMFESAGKLDAFERAAGLPAIYVLELRLPGQGSAGCSSTAEPSTRLRLVGARIALDANVSLSANVELRDENITSVKTLGANSCPEIAAIQLDGLLLLPGLINAHDHLEFGLYPNLGRGHYLNSEEWANDIHKNDSAIIASLQPVPKHTRLWWGAIRNLLCGVTTVCHHNPLQPDLLHDDFPVRVLRDFGWAHSLAMEEDPESKFRATPDDFPFFVHACEGVDEASAGEIAALDRMSMLDGRTFLIHGLGLTGDGIALLNRRGAALIWCPTSNRFLFGRTHRREAISSFERILLGSDSPLTSAGDLLDEVRVAHTEVGVSAGNLYAMVFDRAAKLLRLRQGQGSIRPGARADLVAVRDSNLTPDQTLASLTAKQIELVMIAGRVNLASERLYKNLPSHTTAGLEPLEVDCEVRWVRAPLKRLFKEIEPVLGCEITLGGKRVRYAGTT